MWDPFDRIMGDMSSGQASRSTSSSRIPKRDHRHSPEKDAPSSKRSNPGFTTPSSATRIGRDSFAAMDMLDVQMNMFALKLSKMPRKIQRIHVDTLMHCSDGEEINLNLGVVAVGGDVNSLNRRLAEHLIMRKFHEKKRHLFSNQSYHVMAYDGAAELYVPAGVYTGSDEEETSFSKEDFSSEDWGLVSKVSRRKDDKFLIRLKPAGFVETQGVDALEASHRMKLTRCVEIVTTSSSRIPKRDHRHSPEKEHRLRKEAVSFQNLI